MTLQSRQSWMWGKLGSLPHSPPIAPSYITASSQEKVQKLFAANPLPQRWWKDWLLGGMLGILTFTSGISYYQGPKRAVLAAPPSASPAHRGQIVPPAAPVPGLRTPIAVPSSPSLQSVGQSPLPNPELSAPPDFYRGKIVASVSLRHAPKVIALTFDDGPWPGTTPQVLEILRAQDVKATFFWIGQHLQNHPEIAQQVVAEGHGIGNHTWSHRYRPVNAETAALEIQNTGALITKLTGLRAFFFRPPGGYVHNGLADYATSHQYAVILWSIAPNDYKLGTTSEQIVTKVLQEAKPGGIILLHDGGGDRTATLQALPTIITRLKAQGYTFVTISQLLEIGQQALTPPSTAPKGQP